MVYWQALLGRVIGVLLVTLMVSVLPIFVPLLAAAGLTQPSGILASIPGIIVAEIALLIALITGLWYRLRNRRAALSQTREISSASVGFSALLQSSSFGWLSPRLKTGMLRRAAAGPINVVSTNVGLELYWPLRIAPQRQLYVLGWQFIHAVRIEMQGIRRVLELDLTDGSTTLKFSLMNNSFCPFGNTHCDQILEELRRSLESSLPDSEQGGSSGNPARLS